MNLSSAPSLIHVSETPGTDIFKPRPAPDGRKLVWAVHPDRLVNYLLPRDCPRICLRPAPDSSKSDLAWLASLGAPPIIAVERGWLDRIRATTLYLYRFVADAFTLENENAGYFIAATPVRPITVDTVADPPAAIAATGATLIALDDPWPLHDRAAASTLAFSMIRMRNAAARLSAANTIS